MSRAGACAVSECLTAARPSTAHAKGRLMSLQMAQAKLKADRVTDVTTAAQQLFNALEVAQPEGVRYAWVLLGDGETFAALVQTDDGVENPIPRLPEFQELQASVGDALAGTTDVQSLTVIGSYRMF